MKSFCGPVLLLVGALAVEGGIVYAQVPAGNDTSDGNLNTGTGLGALGGPAASNAGVRNTATGAGALGSNTTGSGNTAYGYEALLLTSTANYNTATGYDALLNNSSGEDNTATGSQALFRNTIGDNNTASGFEALYANTSGGRNTATGVGALFQNTSGADNTATGFNALALNTVGIQLTASGYAALFNNTTGNDNTAAGFAALYANTTGDNNTASGYEALYTNKNGVQNTAACMNALYAATGSNNIAIGYEAGYKVTSGGNNIEIGNEGASADNKVIRIGTEGNQTKTFIAGIYGESVTGTPVYVTSSGQLGVVVSSERFKTDIAGLGDDASKLERLRPVSFHLKTDPMGTLQYGLIAEEVERVYPELVIRDAEGQIQGVRYDELAPLLLSEVQRQRGQMAAEHEKAEAEGQIIKAQADQLVELGARMSELTRQMAEIRQLNESTQAASIIFPLNSDRVATRPHRSVE